MIIDFQIIPHRKQRYDTVGDYFLRKGRWMFCISKMKDKRYSVLVFLHEVIEFFLCRLLGIKVKDIDHFDMEYEKAREWNEIRNNSPLGFEKIENTFHNQRVGVEGRAATGLKYGERAPCGCYFRTDPGDDPHAPYHMAHVVATNCERLICEALGIKWEQYCEVVESL